MNPKLRDHLISATNTFLSAFFLSIASWIDIGNLDKATIISLGAVGVRAGIKALQQHFLR